MSPRSYGSCPAQLEGITNDGRPFYFRSRHGAWTLHVGECGWVPNILGWPEYGNDQIATHGIGDMEDPDAIDELVTQHLGSGRRPATYEEKRFQTRCTQCNDLINSYGETLCTKCLSGMLFGDPMTGEVV
jgi:hypothetical protein